MNVIPNLHCNIDVFPKNLIYYFLHEATHKCYVRTDQIENEERERIYREKKTERMKKRGGFDVTF